MAHGRKGKAASIRWKNNKRYKKDLHGKTNPPEKHSFDTKLKRRFKIVDGVKYDLYD